ncbi:MAG TPA: DUF3471 domain-containing protein [Flavisolibacter sp.]|jgi:hypothetical protein|nr:DUF3471 domain-containing protein [Flavisolibacter sp.]
MKSAIALILLVCCMNVVSHAQDSTLTQYTGTYKFAEGSPTPSVDITIQDGALFANASIGAARMERVGKDTFSIPEHGGMAYFFRNSDGKVKSIRVEVGDMILEGEKQAAQPIAFLRPRSYRFSTR